LKPLNVVGHNPEELALEEDMQFALKVLSDFLLSLNEERF